MKQLYAIVIYCLLFAIPAFSQKPGTKVQLRSGSMAPLSENQANRISAGLRQRMQFHQKHYVLLRFSQLPSAAMHRDLAVQGIRLFDYVPGNAFFAELPEQLSLRNLKQYKVADVFAVDPSLKISRQLQQQEQPGPGQVVAVSFFGSLSKHEVEGELTKAGAELLETEIRPNGIVFVKAQGEVLNKIASLPFVTNVDLQMLKDELLNYNNRAAGGLSALALPAKNLQGRGVTIGVGDNGDVRHVDLTGRLIVRTPLVSGSHGTHVTGTVAGAGIKDPRYKGMAPKAIVISQNMSRILVNTPLYAGEFGMVLTNNSYHSSIEGCPGTGTYDALSNYVDDQLNNNASLLHVFAAGNDGALTCSPFPNSFGTVRSGFQSSKNALVVGNYNYRFNLIDPPSSRGPLKDGRLKPEIMAGGAGTTSTTPGNNYGNSNGTSMSAPAVTGTLALLYERYRQLHGGANPPAILIKAAACNGADDMGNPGPDYSYGFGKLNAPNALEILESNHYFINDISNGNTATHTIPGIPAGAYQVKVMLYWNDPAASPAAPTALVNNLDLTVTGTDNIVHRPLVLNPNPANVNDPATEGVDNRNNIEQVVITNPPAGDLTVNVQGTNIPGGVQHYVVVYQVIQPSVWVEYPFGGERIVPGETEYIRWNAFGGGNNTFTLEYSLDNGGAWTTIDANVPATSRLYAWTFPASPSNQALVRVTQNTTGLSDVSDQDFTILGQPAITATNPCPGYIQLNWAAIPSATGYEILKLQGDSMKVAGSTNGTAYLLDELGKDSSYWVAVRALIGSSPGRASIAANLTPNGGNCAAATFNNDLTIDSMLSPVSGRMHTSSQLGLQPIQVRIRNNGSVPVSGPYDIFYQVNGGSVVQQTSSVVVPAASTVNFSFPSYDFSATGTYTLKVWVRFAADAQVSNDTINSIVKHLQNDPIILNPAFTESFETATDRTYTSKTIGLDGLDRGDFNTSNTNGRVRAFIDPGFARTGSKALILDQVKASATSSADSAMLTFNLSNYSPTDQLWLDFYYRNQGIDFSLPGNQVWIRGNDQAAWIPVFTLPLNNGDFGIYRPAKSVNITETLANAVPAQTISSSFQVKFGEEGYTSTNEVVPVANLDDGLLYDDVMITRPSNDVGIISILSPATTAICSLGNAENVTIRLKNYSSINLSNIEVSFKLNGSVTTQTVSLLAGETGTYTFPATVNLSAFQTYTLRAWVHYNGDNYPNNDSLPEVSFITTPLITSFPYLENFESNDGHWYSGGSNNSWAWGPAQKTIINKAASGSRIWTTGLTGGYNDNEMSYLYSPCFNLTGMSQPVLSFSHIWQTEDNCDCDYHYVEYSTDDVNWTRLGTAGSGTNWYDYSPKQAWKLSGTTWRVSSINIPSSFSKVRFRFVMSSDAGVSLEGVGIDDVHIFDQAPIYTGADIVSGISQPVSGSNWTNFDVGGNRVLAINPQGQDLGNVTIKMFRNTGPVRFTSSQYYLDRNIVIQPTNAPASPVLVRFHFTNAEAVSLMAATGCPSCTKPADPYEVGVTQFSGTTANENGTLSDNTGGAYGFLRPRIDVTTVPYDNGYYAQYAVTHFSEFWINGGGPGQNQSLPITLETFTATRNNNTALLQWSTSQEVNSSEFIIEKSSDGTQYHSIGEVAAAGNSHSRRSYQFTDPDLQAGINYYRLRITDINGEFRYSPVRLLSGDNDDLIVSLYPNPVTKGTLYIRSSIDIDRIELTDISGRVVLRAQGRGRQYDLSLEGLAKGTYFVSVITAKGRSLSKIVAGNRP